MVYLGDTCSCLSSSILWFIDLTLIQRRVFSWCNHLISLRAMSLVDRNWLLQHIWIRCWRHIVFFKLFAGYMIKVFCDIDMFFWSAAVVQFLQSLSNSILMITRPYIACVLQLRLTMVVFLCVFTGLLLDLNLNSICSPLFHFPCSVAFLILPCVL